MKKMKITSSSLILASVLASPCGLFAQKASDAKMEAIAKELKAAGKWGKLSEEEAKAKKKGGKKKVQIFPCLILPLYFQFRTYERMLLL